MALTSRARVLGLICVASLISACGGGDQGPDNTPALITLSPSTASLQGGATTQLTAVVKNAGGTELPGQTLSYSSSATNIVTVSSSGLVTAVGPAGTANITASVGTVTSTAAVITVSAGAAKTIAKSADLPASPAAGSSNTVSVKITDAFGNPVTGTAVTFAVTAGGGSVTPPTATSDASGVASTVFKVSNTLTANTATATSAGLTGSPVTFSATTVAGLAANIAKAGTDPVSLVAGATAANWVSVLVTDAVGNPKSGVAVTFAATAGGGSISPTTATTDASGKASASVTSGTTVGTNTFTATVSGLTPLSFSTVTVAGPTASVSITSPKLSVVNAGNTFTPTVVAKDANGNATSASSVTYTSRTTSVATVSSSGVVSGAALGQSMIVASGTAGADSVLAIVASPTGPVLQTDLTGFELTKGATFTTTIVMDMRSSGEKLGSTTINVAWDPAVIAYVSNASTGTGPSPTVNSSNASAGTLSFSVADASGFSGAVQLLKITFTAAGAAGKSGTLALTPTEVTGAGTFTNLLAKTVSVSHPIITK